MLQTLQTHGIVVRDLPAARAWYGRVLGLEPSFDQPFYVGFSVGDNELGLMPVEPGLEPGPGGTRAYWRVADVQAVLAHWQAHGARLIEAPTTCGGVSFASVGDPDGNIIGFIQLPD